MTSVNSLCLLVWMCSYTSLHQLISRYQCIICGFVEHHKITDIADKFGRTALIHAVMDGNSQVAAYLLSRGANPNLADGSSNSPLHYAVAYGWYFCMKLLLEAGANPDAPNMWKV